MAKHIIYYELGGHSNFCCTTFVILDPSSVFHPRPINGARHSHRDPCRLRAPRVPQDTEESRPLRSSATGAASPNSSARRTGASHARATSAAAPRPCSTPDAGVAASALPSPRSEQNENERRGMWVGGDGRPPRWHGAYFYCTGPALLREEAISENEIRVRETLTLDYVSRGPGSLVFTIVSFLTCYIFFPQQSNRGRHRRIILACMKRGRRPDKAAVTDRGM